MLRGYPSGCVQFRKAWGCTEPMLSYEDIILLREERVLVIQEHEDGRCWFGQTWH
jgi:hypothetical protein